MDALLEQYEKMGVSGEVYQYGEKILRGLSERFQAIDEIAEYNQAKVLHAMQKTGWQPLVLPLPPATAMMM